MTPKIQLWSTIWKLLLFDCRRYAGKSPVLKMGRGRMRQS